MPMTLSQMVFAEIRKKLELGKYLFLFIYDLTDFFLPLMATTDADFAIIMDRGVDELSSKEQLYQLELLNVEKHSHMGKCISI